MLFHMNSLFESRTPIQDEVEKLWPWSSTSHLRIREQYLEVKLTYKFNIQDQI